MPFQIQPVRQFLVRPALPPQLARLSELAYNLLWTWDPVIRAVFRRLDPGLWKESGYNPTAMLNRVSQSTLDKAAADHRYLAHYAEACQHLDAHMEGDRAERDGKLIAYFSAEFGLTECLPIYSGGLGVLSGDHLKSASDCRIPLAALGLIYQQGYFRQFLNPDGWQQERYLDNDFYTLPIVPVKDAEGRDLQVSVTLPTGPVAIQVWRLEVGRIHLYLLDTNVRENLLPQDRQITSQLYGGDLDTRIRQEIVLGVGGVRALKALGLEPTVFHMNEGHSAFLAVERIRMLMQERGLSFDEAWDASRTNNIFTTHTPVPAGIDLFDEGMMHYYFQAYCQEAGIDFEQLMALGRRHPMDHSERFSMAVLALKTSSYRNGVSRLHRRVSEEMWSELWPGLPTWEVPITSVTNGVHLPSWLSSELSDLYDQYLQPDWREHTTDPRTWDLVNEIPDEELLEAHRRRKRRMIAFIRERQTQSAFRRRVASIEQRYAADVLDPNVITIGVARRFATYKRPTLLFRDVERLKRILCNKERPVQIVVSGKAHPKDHPAKTEIRDVVQFSRDAELWKHVVFVEDYDMNVGRELVQSVDLWLSMPRRGEEACGTSGMKAGINGVLNLGVLDGWYDEASEDSGGWSIGDREAYSEEQDAIHATAIYYLLEHEIVPMFYDRRDHAAAWVKRMKQSIRSISPGFDCRRMVQEYKREMYEPAHAAFRSLRAGGFEQSRERRRWYANVQEVWDRVRFVDANGGPTAPVTSGAAVEVRAAIDLAGLKPDDVRVEMVMGRVGASGALEDTEVLMLPPVEQNGAVTIFGKQIVPSQTGRLGYALRVSPNHYDDPLTRPCYSLLKWET